VNYWRMNTDKGPRDDRTCDLWYAHGVAAAGDCIEYRGRHSHIFTLLAPGDGIFMHHSEVGIVGFGIVTAKWEPRDIERNDMLVYCGREEAYEYRIPVDWDPRFDCRDRPLPIFGRLPYAGAFSRVDPLRWNIQDVLEDMKRRRNEANR
jgi:hypothetical protein